MKIIFRISLLLWLLHSSYAFAQPLSLSLEEAITIAQQSSLDMFRYKNMYRQKVLNFEDFRMALRPQLNLALTPMNYNRSIVEEYNSELGKYEPVEIQRITSQYQLNLTQKVGLTGGNLNVYSSLMRSQQLGDTRKDLDFISTPFSISYRQNFSQINNYKWQTRIEPLKFEQAKLDLIEQRESIALKAVDLFFRLLSDQKNLEIARLNLDNAITLLEIGEKRGKIGSISRDNLLNLELKKVNAEISLKKAANDVESSQLDLCNFLELPLSAGITCLPPNAISLLSIDARQAKEIALLNSPDSHNLQQKILEARKQLQAAKLNAFDISVEAGVGFNQNKESFSAAYQDLLNRQNFRLAVNIPLVDWKENKRRIERAKLNSELAEKEEKKTRTEIEIEVFKIVNEFNIKENELESAIQADSISQMAYDATRELFSLGKVNVIAINDAYKAMYNAKNQYINVLRSYWYYYYTIRKLCLYNFSRKEELRKELETILNTKQ